MAGLAEILAPLPALSAALGLLSLDATAALQFMLSRPIVAGGLVGWMLGDPGQGLAAGSLVELLWLGGLPVGSLVPSDATAAAAMAAAAAILLKQASPLPGAAQAAAALGLLAALPMGWLAARGEILQRRLANRLSRRAEALLRVGQLKSWKRLVLASLGLTWLRASLVCALGLGLGLPLLGALLERLPEASLRGLEWTYWLYWLLALAAAAQQFWERSGVSLAALLALGLAALARGLDASAAAGPAWQPLLLALAAAHLAGAWRWWRSRRGEQP